MKKLTLISLMLLSFSSFGISELKKCKKICKNERSLCLDNVRTNVREDKSYHRFQCREDYEMCFELCAHANGKSFWFEER